jgi:hypothetical protein
MATKRAADPVTGGFVNQLPAINTLANSSSGFIWRLQSETGDNAYLRPYDMTSVQANSAIL